MNVWVNEMTDKMYTLNMYARLLYYILLTTPQNLLQQMLLVRVIYLVTDSNDPDQKHLLEEILGSVREIKAEAAARNLRKAAKAHCFSELLVSHYTVDLRC